MYGEGNSVSTIAPPLTTMGTVTLLPATGADPVTSIAISIAAGLVVWGAAYLIQAIKR